MEFEFLVDKKSYKINIEFKKNLCVAELNNKKYKVDFDFISPNVLSLIIEEKSYIAYVAEDKDRIYVSINGEEFIIEKKKEESLYSETREESPAQVDNFVTAPMPGKVIKINVSEGDRIKKNQVLAIVEAMKMENELRSPVDGKVKKILVKINELVDAFQPIIELAKE
ncbi:acetyl-CoA carboxylase biotin carboxyl carrier protein subunit [SCandidatus Aminicenantes bacterium Aminicenantia_JdfR_composite]|jgi:biotin carboxyl carrier protein|nr:acetyl-CoA carboxylase biotin carboxyl carrier protein subunit [SCandidatus Aminicenantes bacterium Aminicenantia_JdfR_composite]MCP2596873.1 acetyl-CoA carboxylase biotin carboxyl carrier protein subunit [Candidatus Aminicenantes bacterium AC-335-G13]MCP2598492.1 acetyl-CoA carboxylase biotin carboxyl carrier protein subunit [Candidatus Aminicenantes bacterium AC-335-L06]MCP2605832.1 acetyl-CoA carboxylase biotin carboxyl carrier protein subunit [Candidatus Aminicenantes bacterium AC-335-O07